MAPPGRWCFYSCGCTTRPASCSLERSSLKFITPDAHGEAVTVEDRVRLGLPAIELGPDAPASPARANPTPRTLPPAWRHHLMESALKYLEARGLLLSLEAKEAFVTSVGLVVLALTAVIVIFAAWLLLATAFVGWLTSFMGWNWVNAAAAAGVLHVILAIVIIGLTWWKFGRAAWFGATINELKEDRLWLRGQASKN